MDVPDGHPVGHAPAPGNKSLSPVELSMPSPTAVALFWVAVAVCTLAQVALLHSFFLGASRPAHGSTAAFRATETAWAVVPAVILALLLAATWQAMHPSAAARIRITVPADAPLVPPPSMIEPGAAPATPPTIAPTSAMSQLPAAAMVRP